MAGPNTISTVKRWRYLDALIARGGVHIPCAAKRLKVFGKEKTSVLKKAGAGREVVDRGGVNLHIAPNV